MCQSKCQPCPSHVGLQTSISTRSIKIPHPNASKSQTMPKHIFKHPDLEMCVQQEGTVAGLELQFCAVLQEVHEESIKKSEAHIHLEDVEEVKGALLWVRDQLKISSVNGIFCLAILHQNHPIETCQCLDSISMPNPHAKSGDCVALVFGAAGIFHLPTLEPFQRNCPQEVDYQLQYKDAPSKTWLNIS